MGPKVSASLPAWSLLYEYEYEYEHEHDYGVREGVIVTVRVSARVIVHTLKEITRGATAIKKCKNRRTRKRRRTLVT